MTDRLSDLPDEILRLILTAAELDVKSAVQTSLISRRWHHLWKSTSLQNLHFNGGDANFTKFFRNVKSFRGQDEELAVLSLAVDSEDLESSLKLVDPIFSYGLACRVRTFRLWVGTWLHNFPPGLVSLCKSVQNLDISLWIRSDFLMLPPDPLGFVALRDLRLVKCDVTKCEELFAGARNLEKLALIDCVISCGRWLYVGTPKLKRLELVDCQTPEDSNKEVRIRGEELAEIVMAFTRSKKSHSYKTAIHAPRVTSFACCGVKPANFSKLHLPSLGTFDIDVIWSQQNRALPEKTKDLHHMFRLLRIAKCVRLHPNAIKALLLDPCRLKWHDSPFERIKCLELDDCEDFMLGQTWFNSLISYFFGRRIQNRGSTLYHRTFIQQYNHGISPIVVRESEVMSE